MSDFETRFGGIARLYGRGGLAKLRAAHVGIIGIGGVGAWAAEALARSGIGALTLVDLDEVCVTNINRQLHALTETVGRSKVGVMAERIRAINPDCKINGEQKFFNEQTAGELLSLKFDFVLDAIDDVPNKVLLLAHCREKNMPVVACGAAGGRRDATLVRVADLANVSHDRLLAEVRKKLRKDFNFPGDGSPMAVDCVFSAEPPVFAQPDGSVCETRAPAEAGTRLNCNGGLGSATFVTGTFGFAAAGVVVQKIAERR
ncbi:MAG TPA: tRNA threonylcarbamoyladenosine dehydratase [Verrucomicrobiae bacterium]|jgi:tRNA A37 threonylcarbamoyladenosine dehydratase